MNTVVSPSKSFPIGVTVYPSGVNFSVFAQGNTAVELLLFDQADDSHPSRTITLDPVANHSCHYWHVFVPGIEAGQIYGYRVDGSFAPERGLRFDPQKVLLDPYGRAIARPANYSRVAASRPGDNCAAAINVSLCALLFGCAQPVILKLSATIRAKLIRTTNNVWKR
jgi:isoamylase